jgi:hypothetical protein
MTRKPRIWFVGESFPRGAGRISNERREDASMAKVGVVVLADTETAGDLGRVVNALITAREAKEAGDDVTVIFDGAGTKWVGELSNPEHSTASCSSG